MSSKKIILVFLSFFIFYLLYQLKAQEIKIEKLDKEVSESTDLYESFYGFIIDNGFITDFYSVDKDIMQKYISPIRFDTMILKEDLKKANWLSTYRSRTFEYYAFRYYLYKYGKNDIDSIMLETCKSGNIKSKIIPVYITQFNHVLNNKKKQLDSCNSYFHTVISSQPILNSINIIPLNYHQSNELLNIKDTISRVKYQEYLKSWDPSYKMLKPKL